MPPLNLLLGRTSQEYGIRTLCQKDDHPCKAPLLRMVKATNTRPQYGTGLQRIAEMVWEHLQSDPPLEDVSDHDNTPLQQPQVGLGKKDEAK